MPPRHGKTRTTEQRTDMAEKQRHALQLRNSGWSVQDVADHYQVDKSTVSRWCTAAIADIPREEATEFRQRQLMQLDALMKTVWEPANNAKNKGFEWKIDRALAIMERQAKLYGLDKLAEIEALKAAKSDPGEESGSMMSVLLEGLQNAYIAQKNAADETVDGVDQ